MNGVRSADGSKDRGPGDVHLRYPHSALRNLPSDPFASERLRENRFRRAESGERRATNQGLASSLSALRTPLSDSFTNSEPIGAGAKRHFRFSFRAASPAPQVK